MFLFGSCFLSLYDTLVSVVFICLFAVPVCLWNHCVSLCLYSCFMPLCSASVCVVAIGLFVVYLCLCSCFVYLCGSFVSLKRFCVSPWCFSVSGGYHVSHCFSFVSVVILSPFVIIFLFLCGRYLSLCSTFASL